MGHCLLAMALAHLLYYQTPVSYETDSVSS